MGTRRKHGWIGWALVLVATLGPIGLAWTSPLLAYRDAIYVLSGFAGIFGMTLLLMQPLLAADLLPDLPRRRARTLHRWIGALLVVSIILHVAGLWITSPPDVIDALTFTSPTPFSIWGVIAMWAIFATAGITAARRKIGLRKWRTLHIGLALITGGGTIAHALLIEGTMEPVSKAILSGLIATATLWAVLKTRQGQRQKS